MQRSIRYEQRATRIGPLFSVCLRALHLSPQNKNQPAWGCPPLVLTDVSPARLDDDGPPAAGLLLHQRHALAGLLVRVIGGAHRDLVLDPGQAVQLNAAFAVTTDGARVR